MKPASEERELGQIMLDYCIDILTAKDEEELVLIKQEIVTSLTELGLNEATVQAVIEKADEMIENEDITIAEDGTITIFGKMYAVLNTELRTPTSVYKSEQNTNSGNSGGILIGLGLTALLSVLALKKAMFNKNKQNEDSRSR